MCVSASQQLCFVVHYDIIHVMSLVNSIFSQLLFLGVSLCGLISLCTLIPAQPK